MFCNLQLAICTWDQFVFIFSKKKYFFDKYFFLSTFCSKCVVCVQQEMDVLMDNIQKSHVFVTSEKASVNI